MNRQDLDSGRVWGVFMVAAFLGLGWGLSVPSTTVPQAGAAGHPGDGPVAGY
jgi:hypothetical protein